MTTRKSSSRISVPDPTSALDAANKGYVDTKIAGVEPAITPGTTAQYRRGDKTWQTLNSAAVGLGSVNNTADSAKNVLSATKLTTARTINGVSFDGTANITVTDSTKEPLIAAGTTAQYRRGDKTWQTLNAAAVGLGNVDNTSDAAKPISTATQTALNGKQASLGFTPENAANRGQPNGYASLDQNGLIPSGQLPSYVDDVMEYTNLAGFPATGESGKIYVAQDTNKTYRWSGSVYVEISASPGTTDDVVEGATNLYFTTARASAAAPVKSVAGRTGAVTLTKADVLLGNVDNTADSAKLVASAAKLTTARTINGVSFDGTANITVADSTAVHLTGDESIGGNKTFTARPTIQPASGSAGVFLKNAANYVYEFGNNASNGFYITDNNTSRSVLQIAAGSPANALSVGTAQTTMSQPLSLSNNKITDVANPTAASDVATKAYVDSAAGAVGWAPEVVVNSNQLTNGYNDMDGGVLVEPGPAGKGILLDAVSIRIGDAATTISGGDLQVQIQLGSPTSVQTTLVATITLANGQHDVVASLGSAVACVANTVLRANIILGSVTLYKALYIQFRGRYA